MPGAGARPGGLPRRGGLLAAEGEGTPRCWRRGPGRTRGRRCRQAPQPQPLTSLPGGLGPRPALRASSRPAAVKVGAGKGPGAEAASVPPVWLPAACPVCRCRGVGPCRGNQHFPAWTPPLPPCGCGVTSLFFSAGFAGHPWPVKRYPVKLEPKQDKASPSWS